MAKIFFEIVRQGEEDVCIASWARWNAQLKRSGGVGKRCQILRQEVKLLSERQKLKGMVEDRIRLQGRATEKYYERFFEEMKELEEQTSEEALILVQEKHDLCRCQNERDEARRLQITGSSRRMKKEADSQDLLSFESCKSSAAEHAEER